MGHVLGYLVAVPEACNLLNVSEPQAFLTHRTLGHNDSIQFHFRKQYLLIRKSLRFISNLQTLSQVYNVCVLIKTRILYSQIK